MRCAYYCTGDSYDLNKVSEFFAAQGNATKLYKPEVLYIKLNSVDASSSNDLFVFSYGCVAFWGLEKEREVDILKSIHQFISQPLETSIEDSCKFQLGAEETWIDEENDTMILEDDDPNIKLSLSYGLSQSVKLQFFENSVDRTIDLSKHIPYEIIRTGKIQYSRKNLAIKIGEILAERNSINLHSSILDMPEFFWRRPRYEPYYNKAVDFMDIDFRLEVLNKRLEVLHDLYEVLTNELQHLQSSRLELIIILLIFIEVTIVVFKEINLIF